MLLKSLRLLVLTAAVALPLSTFVGCPGNTPPVDSGDYGVDSDMEMEGGGADEMGEEEANSNTTNL